jgi:hypothetical protein
MFYYLYEIKNNLNGKIYVGVHKTNNMNDGYMGSGKSIRAAINKYGIGNFTKNILEIFTTSEEMFAREAEVVTDEFLLRENVYNLCRGGHGGWEYVHKNNMNNGFLGKTHSAETKKLISVKSSAREHSDNACQKMSDNHWSKFDPIAQKEHAARAAKITNENRTPSIISKISQTVTENWKTVPYVKCPNCGKEGRGGSMTRWHFDKCKIKN